MFDFETVLIRSTGSRRAHLRVLGRSKTLCGLGTWSALIGAGNLPPEPLCGSCAKKRDTMNEASQRITEVLQGETDA